MSTVGHTLTPSQSLFFIGAVSREKARRSHFKPMSSSTGWWFQPENGDGAREAKHQLEEAERLLERAKHLQQHRHDVDKANGMPQDTLATIDYYVEERHRATQNMIDELKNKLEKGWEVYAASIVVETMARGDLSEAAGMALRSGVDMGIVDHLFDGY